MAAGNEAFADWNSAIAQVIGALETDDLPRLLVDALKTHASPSSLLSSSYIGSVEGRRFSSKISPPTIAAFT